METRLNARDVSSRQRPPRPPSARLTLALGFAAIAVVGLLLGAKVYADRSMILKEAMHEAGFSAELVAANTNGAMFGVMQMLMGVKAYIQAVDAEPLGEYQVRNHMLMIKTMDPMVQDMLILDDKGVISNWTGRGAPPNVRHLEYDKPPAEGPFPLLHVIGPHESPIQPSLQCFAASMPLHGTLSAASTTAVALLDLDFLHRQFAEVELPPGAAISLATPSGVILSSSIKGEDTAGWEIPRLGELWDSGKPNGVLTLTSPDDGKDYLTAFTRVEHNRLLALGFRDKSMLLEKWRAKAVPTILAWVVLVAFVTPVTIFSVRGQERIARMASTDPLTGLPNRRTFVHAAKNELERARRYGHTAAALLIDIDHFKRVNDTHGHDVGDLALQAVSRLLDNACRASDKPCRYGGEEFAMLLPETDEHGAQTVAEKIRAMVEAATIDTGQTHLRVTCSIGMAVWRGQDDPLDDLLKRADTALYEAKETGRNQVCQG